MVALVVIVTKGKIETVVVEGDGHLVIGFGEGNFGCASDGEGFGNNHRGYCLQVYDFDGPT